jgi:hypothetical protein
MGILFVTRRVRGDQQPVNIHDHRRLDPVDDLMQRFEFFLKGITAILLSHETSLCAANQVANKISPTL